MYAASLLMDSVGLSTTDDTSYQCALLHTTHGYFPKSLGELRFIARHQDFSHVGTKTF